MYTILATVLIGGYMLHSDHVSAQSTGALVLPQTETQEQAIDLLTHYESEFGPEFLQALRFAYDNGLTKYKTTESFKPYELLTREQASKIVGVFAKDVMGYTWTNPGACIFDDQAAADPTLSEHITNACKLGIFKGTPDGNFDPQRSITKAEGLTVIIRMFNKGSLDESGEPWYLNYYLKARELELTKEKNIFALDRSLTRYEMILLLYRFHVKYSILEDIQQDEQNPQQLFGIKTVGEGVAVIDSAQFLDQNIEKIDIEISGTRYILKKTNLVSQFDNADTRYGDLYIVAEGEDTTPTYIGIATFNFVNEKMTTGNIRPIEISDDYFALETSDIPPFYQIQTIVSTQGNNNTETNIATGSIGTGN